jgi:hypothetical protein
VQLAQGDGGGSSAGSAWRQGKDEESCAGKLSGGGAAAHAQATMLSSICEGIGEGV